jgi:two-component system sensor histidine kinase YesM
MHPSPYTKGARAQNIISFRRVVKSGTTGDTLGVIETNVNESHLSELYANVRLGKTSQVFIINAAGKVVSAPDKARLYSDLSNAPYFDFIATNDGAGKLFTLEGRRTLVISRRYPRLDWIITGTVPLDEVTADNRNLAVSIVAVGALGILIFTLLAEVIAANITRPIHRLKSVMVAVGHGDLEARAEMLRNDEVGVLAGEFDRMVRQVSALMDKLLHEQRARKDYEFAMLQAQINPHFLYNTLEGICGLARLRRSDDVVNAISHLAAFYRGVLGKGGPLITLGEELRTTEHYLKILQTRYGSVLEYEIVADPGALSCCVLRCTLQPLVENSLQHGLGDRRSIHVRIEGWREGDRLALTVSDDGVGMSPEVAAAALGEATADDLARGLGLRSVNDRIKLYFGSDYGLAVASASGEGAKVVITLPSSRELRGC